MTLKLNNLAMAATVVFATAAAAAQTQPTTTETQPTTSESQPSTMQTGTQTPPTASEPAATDQPAATQTEQITKATVKATADDIKAGASVYDESGGLVGKVDSVDSKGAIVNTGKVRAQIALSSFGKNDKGLVVSITKADLDAQAKKETAKETKPKS
jgi:myo-inositol-hexaphosphate 3-phosphohydrolase